jgi:hypothetical protein
MKNFAKANNPGTKLINWCVKITGGLNNWWKLPSEV